MSTNRYIFTSYLIIIFLICIVLLFFSPAHAGGLKKSNKNNPKHTQFSLQQNSDVQVKNVSWHIEFPEIIHFGEIVAFYFTPQSPLSFNIVEPLVLTATQDGPVDIWMSPENDNIPTEGLPHLDVQVPFFFDGHFDHHRPCFSTRNKKLMGTLFISENGHEIKFTPLTGLVSGVAISCMLRAKVQPTQQSSSTTTSTIFNISSTTSSSIQYILTDTSKNTVPSITPWDSSTIGIINAEYRPNNNLEKRFLNLLDYSYAAVSLYNLPPNTLFPIRWTNLIYADVDYQSMVFDFSTHQNLFPDVSNLLGGWQCDAPYQVGGITLHYNADKDNADIPVGFYIITNSNFGELPPPPEEEDGEEEFKMMQSRNNQNVNNINKLDKVELKQLLTKYKYNIMKKNNKNNINIKNDDNEDTAPAATSLSLPITQCALPVSKDSLSLGLARIALSSPLFIGYDYMDGGFDTRDIEIGLQIGVDGTFVSNTEPYIKDNMINHDGTHQLEVLNVKKQNEKIKRKQSGEKNIITLADVVRFNQQQQKQQESSTFNTLQYINSINKNKKQQTDNNDDENNEDIPIVSQDYLLKLGQPSRTLSYVIPTVTMRTNQTQFVSFLQGYTTHKNPNFEITNVDLASFYYPEQQFEVDFNNDNDNNNKDVDVNQQQRRNIIFNTKTEATIQKQLNSIQTSSNWEDYYPETPNNLDYLDNDDDYDQTYPANNIIDNTTSIYNSKLQQQWAEHTFIVFAQNVSNLEIYLSRVPEVPDPSVDPVPPDDNQTEPNPPPDDNQTDPNPPDEGGGGSGGGGSGGGGSGGGAPIWPWPNIPCPDWLGWWTCPFVMTSTSSTSTSTSLSKPEWKQKKTTTSPARRRTTATTTARTTTNTPSNMKRFKPLSAIETTTTTTTTTNTFISSLNKINNLNDLDLYSDNTQNHHHIYTLQDDDDDSTPRDGSSNIDPSIIPITQIPDNMINFYQYENQTPDFRDFMSPSVIKVSDGSYNAVLNKLNISNLPTLDNFEQVKAMALTFGVEIHRLSDLMTTSDDIDDGTLNSNTNLHSVSQNNEEILMSLDNNNNNGNSTTTTNSNINTNWKVNLGNITTPRIAVLIVTDFSFVNQNNKNESNENNENNNSTSPVVEQQTLFLPFTPYRFTYQITSGEDEDKDDGVDDGIENKKNTRFITKQHAGLTPTLKIADNNHNMTRLIEVNNNYTIFETTMMVSFFNNHSFDDLLSLSTNQNENNFLNNIIDDNDEHENDNTSNITKPLLFWDIDYPLQVGISYEMRQNDGIGDCSVIMPLSTNTNENNNNNNTSPSTLLKVVQDAEFHESDLDSYYYSTLHIKGKVQLDTAFILRCNYTLNTNIKLSKSMYNIGLKVLDTDFIPIPDIIVSKDNDTDGIMNNDWKSEIILNLVHDDYSSSPSSSSSSDFSMKTGDINNIEGYNDDNKKEQQKQQEQQQKKQGNVNKMLLLQDDDATNDDDDNSTPQQDPSLIWNDLNHQNNKDIEILDYSAALFVTIKKAVHSESQYSTMKKHIFSLFKKNIRFKLLSNNSTTTTGGEERDSTTTSSTTTNTILLPSAAFFGKLHVNDLLYYNPGILTNSNDDDDDDNNIDNDENEITNFISFPRNIIYPTIIQDNVGGEDDNGAGDGEGNTIVPHRTRVVFLLPSKFNITHQYFTNLTNNNNIITNNIIEDKYYTIQLYLLHNIITLPKIHYNPFRLSQQQKQKATSSLSYHPLLLSTNLANGQKCLSTTQCNIDQLCYQQYCTSINDIQNKKIVLKTQLFTQPDIIRHFLYPPSEVSKIFINTPKTRISISWYDDGFPYFAVIVPIIMVIILLLMLYRLFVQARGIKNPVYYYNLKQQQRVLDAAATKTTGNNNNQTPLQKKND